ncbi:MAG: WD40-repeat-containing domain protein [Benniella sp.]|nr:MAG: WD40-repeat-containing domain protein [Benniella sp.]
MVLWSIISSPRASLSLQQVLDLANVYLENARKAVDPNIALVLCHDTEVSLSQVKKAAKHTNDTNMREDIASIYIDLGDFLETQGRKNEAQAFYKKSIKWGGRTPDPNRPRSPSRPASLAHSIKSAVQSADLSVDKPSPLTPPPALDQSPHKQPPVNANAIHVTMAKHIFPRNVRPPIIPFHPPEPDTRLSDTRQLAYCLGLLQTDIEPNDVLDPIARNWVLNTKNESDERERLKTLATDVIRTFKRDEFKDAKSVTEVVFLASVLERDDFRYLVKEFYSGIDQSGLLDVHQLEGLARLIQGARSGDLDSDDLVQVLKLLSTRLRDTHEQSTNHLYQLTVAVSHVLDAMADASVAGLNRETIHEPLSAYLDGLKKSPDPYLVYQAAYAYQALLCIPDDESLWQATLRRSGKVFQGVSGLVSAVKGLDLNGFIEGLGKIQEGLAGASEVVQVVKTAYKGVVALGESGQGFLECLQEGLSFSQKCAWYTARRGADALIRDGSFIEFRRLVCEAPCRSDVAFQWGVCQQLGEIAANSEWNGETRRSAIAFLGEIYQDDVMWGYHTNVKQWILSILMQLTLAPGGETQFVETQLQELRKNGDTEKQELYRMCHESGPGSHPFKVVSSEIGSPSLLDRVQERPDVEGSLRQMRRQRLKEREKVVYIPPQAKAGLQASDDVRFPLLEKVDEFLASDQQVFLLLGDSGAGKSTFNKEFECHLWRAYKKGGTIPLHINLPAIDKPEQDMIPKHLRRCEFTEPQIRELKLHHNFILICDGYDESQQTNNLYTSNRLNQPGEWNAKMVISCRSEYLGVDYRDRFQPGDRNERSETTFLQEAAITPFSMDQVQNYITQYVAVHRPLWGAGEYEKALDLIPSLKELVKNPFLMSLSLEVLPRMVDPGQDLSGTRITRMALYDQFIEHWMERGKKRLGERKLSAQARAAFESLSDEGFTRNGIDYLKRLSVAIYKEQGGQPIVTYSRYRDEKSWKAPFFSREEETQILREACPLIRNGNQHRFIHRSLLEYGVALAIFDPHEWKTKTTSEATSGRRKSVGSVMSSDEQDVVEEDSAMAKMGLNLNSPLAWRRFKNAPSVLQFLEERMQQESLFKQQLFGYIEESKKDKKWRTAAANAMTVLVRAGEQFNSADLRGIQIPHADLSQGVFDSVQLQGADLRYVDFRGAWLRRANLSKAQMTDALFGELPLKQESKVILCVYSPDGKTVAVGLDNHKICVYSTSDWETLWTLEEHSSFLTGIIYSPDGNRIASSSADWTVRIWNILTGVCLHVLNGFGGWVYHVAYSPQGDQLASACGDKRVKLWDVESGECRHIWIGHTDLVLRVTYSPKGDQIASCSNDLTVRLWSVETKECLHVLRGHDRSIQSVVYSPQGDQLASASMDTTVRLWNASTGECRHILSGHTSYVVSVMYSPNGKQLASASWDYTARLWDADTGMCLHVLQEHTREVQKIVYLPHGGMVVSASHDNTVRAWDTATGVCIRTLTGHSGEVRDVDLSPHGDKVASGSKDGTVRLWDVRAESPTRPISSGHAQSVYQVKCSLRGGLVATCSRDKTVRLWDIQTGFCQQTLRGHTDTVKCVDFSPQGGQIASGSFDRTVRLWSVDTGACTHILAGHVYWVWNVAYAPHGDQLASASEDKTVKLWDVTSGECRRTLSGHTYLVHGVMYSPSGKQIVSRSHDNTVRIWDVETGECNYTLRSYARFNKFECSRQGNQVAATNDDATVRIWDIGTGECRHVFIGHKGGVWSVAYSPKGDQIASGGYDGSVRIWDTAAMTCLWTLSGHTKYVNRIVYSYRGDLVVSASNDKSVRVWDVTSGQCRAVIQDFQAEVSDIAWIEFHGLNYIVAACDDGVVGMWQVLMDGDHCDVSLRWKTTNDKLDTRDVTIQDVLGLSQLNRKLLKQRGAVGEPADLLREATKKVATMVSVVSKLKVPSLSTTVEDPALKVCGLLRQLEELLEQIKDPVMRDLVAVLVKNIDKCE